MMTATLLMLISGALGALSNLCMRKSMDAQGSAFAFFLIQLFFTFLVVTYMYPIQTGSYSLNLYTLAIGAACGIALGLVKFMLGFALKRGPASLTFASLNCSSVAPAIIIALYFGTWIEFPYTLWHKIGSTLVVIGLLWAVADQTQFLQKWKWIFFALFAFAANTLYLLLTQSHIFIMQNSQWLDEIWRFGSKEIHSEWFIPIIFATATMMHGIIYCLIERRAPMRREICWGTGGGVLNGACAYFFMQATEQAAGIERALIFPTFAVTLIVVCNIWGQWLYNEKVNWRANCLCLLGLVTGSQDV